MKRLKRIICILIVTLVFFENPVATYAATDDVVNVGSSQSILRGKIKYAPTTLKELFDVNYYLMLYPELRAVYGDNVELLYQHFIKYGLSEGRKCSPYLDISKYIANNADLIAEYDTNIDLFVTHYFTCGINEGRSSYATALDIAIQQKIENADIYLNGKLDDDAIKSLYGQAYLEIVLAPNNSDASAYFEVPKSEDNSHIIISNDVIAVPWDYVENGYVTLEMIKAHCGNNLILVQNSNNDVTFIAGDISSRKVTDKNSVTEAVKSFFGVLNFPSDTCYLYLSDEYYDSVGNHIYSFQSRDTATDITSNRILDVNQDIYNSGAVTGTVILKTDKNGNIIGLSSTSNNTFAAFDYSTERDDRYVITDRRYNLKKLDANQIASVLSKEYEVLSYLPQEFIDRGKASYPFYKFFVKKEGAIYMICVSSEQKINSNHLNSSIYPIDEAVYYSTETPGEKSQPFDNLYSNVEVIYRNFIDSNGRKVSLPLASDKNGYYFCAPEYKLILETDLVEGGDDDDIYAQYGLGLYYIDIENPDINAVTIFSNMYEACKAYYEHGGNYNQLPTLMALYAPNLKVNNAYGASDFAFSFMTYCSYKPFIDDISTAGHESTHAYTMEEGLIGTNYVKFSGAISEGYADIVGILIQQKVIEEYLRSESEHTGKSIDIVYNELLESKKWLVDKDDWYSGGAYLEDGTPFWLYKASDPVGTSYIGYSYANKIGDTNFYPYGDWDSYGCHSNSSVLSHIAYEMWNSGVEKDYDKLFDIWYDTAYVMTGDSTFYDVRNYIEASMKEKEYSQEKIDKTMELFDQANIIKETQEFIKVPDNYNPEHYYTDEYINHTGVIPEINVEHIEAPSLNRSPSEEESAPVNDSVEDVESENEIAETAE